MGVFAVWSGPNILQRMLRAGTLVPVDRRPAVPLPRRHVDPHIRELTLYRDLIDRGTGGPPCPMQVVYRP